MIEPGFRGAISTMKSKELDNLLARAKKATAESSTEELIELITDMARAISLLKDKASRAAKNRFGKSGEKISVDAADQDAETRKKLKALQAEARRLKEQIILKGRNPSKEKKKSKKKDPDEIIRNRLSDDLDLYCPYCKGQLKDKGLCHKTIEIDIAETVYLRRQHLLHKAECNCQSLRLVAPPPLRSLEQCELSPRFIAKVIYDKFKNQLPLYRQSQSMAVQGLDISKDRLISLVLRSWVLWQPVVARMREINRRERRLQCDESPVCVVTDHYKGKGYLWCLLSKVAVTFEVSAKRNKKIAREVIGTVAETLTSDRLNIYHNLIDGANESGCLSHLRRKFFDSILSFPDDAMFILRQIGKIYAVEATLKQLSPYQRKKKRNEEMVIYLVTIRTYCEGLSPPSQSSLYKAISYMNNHWAALTYFLKDGNVPLDNNAVEGQLRFPKLGFKNFLFAQSELGAEAIAGFYSIIATTKMYDVNPLEYLADVQTKLFNNWPQNKLDELLPWNWGSEKKKQQSPRYIDRTIEKKIIIERTNIVKKLRQLEVTIQKSNE